MTVFSQSRRLEMCNLAILIFPPLFLKCFVLVRGVFLT